MKISLCSDNIAGASEAVIEAMVQAARMEAMPYGNDDQTRQVERMMSEFFECEVDVFLVSTGTVANCLSLSVMTPPWGSIFCHPESHINVDENTAPEFFTHGAKLISVEGESGKMDPNKLSQLIKQKVSDVHVSPSSAVSLSQVTEIGSLYSLDEIRTITDIAKSAGLKVHMDGARFANALVSLDCTAAEMTWKSGIDILSFGATKNGVMAAEAIVVFNRDLAYELGYRRKRAGQLHSKMRLLSAQMIAYLSNNLWQKNARHANAMTALLQEGLRSIPGVVINTPAQANILFCTMPAAMIEHLQKAGFSFYGGRWEEGVIRLVTSFQTPAEGINAFVQCARDFAASS
ncbi:low specificity L-threonine aldolase [Hahella sp. CCB-MM4]|uniref:threonine aldolase family protein n=1 Tax=Hahella sp. (strain CCB-MM4) TaxID=1926491 RepID=UPI000B9ADA1D|nr:low specificity L-threonine aldolase [Hahella sp. CCB-MM4]OZG72774.1 low specificity L-threonine aldolase [Hahella sp. CCB-MM4]